jgi:hypothetical protein
LFSGSSRPAPKTSPASRAPRCRARASPISALLVGSEAAAEDHGLRHPRSVVGHRGRGHVP